MRPISDRPNITLWTNALVRRLLTDPSGGRIEAVEVKRDGETQRVEAPLVAVCCGAVNSAALLLRSATDRHPDGLANSSGLIGRRYMAHRATMMQGFHPFRKNHVVFQKTVAINDFYLRGPDGGFPLGQIQSQGRTHGVMAQTVVPWMPLWAYNAWVARGVDWLAMSEDLPRSDNRVTVNADGRIRLNYRPNNLVAHTRLVREVKRMLRRLGFWVVMTHSHETKNTTHQCGNRLFRDRPEGVGARPPTVGPMTSRTCSWSMRHSFRRQPRSIRGLTIAAQALRVADCIKETDLGLSATGAVGESQNSGEAGGAIEVFPQSVHSLKPIEL